MEKAFAARQRDKAITADGTSEDKSSLDGGSLSIGRTKVAANIAVPKLLDSALLLEFARSLTDRENWDIHEDVRKANPGFSEKEFCEVKRAVMLKKAHEAWKGRLEEKDKSKEASNSVPLVKDSPSSLLNLGTIKPVGNLELKEQRKGPFLDTKPFSYLTLTKEVWEF